MLETVTLTIPTQAAGAADTWHVPWVHRGTWRIDSVVFAPDVSVALDATNYLTATVKTSSRNGAALQALAPHTTEDVAAGSALDEGQTLTVLGPKPGPNPYSVDNPARIVSEGSQIAVSKAIAGTGAVLAGTYAIRAERTAG